MSDSEKETIDFPRLFLAIFGVIIALTRTAGYGTSLGSILSCLSALLPLFFKDEPIEKFVALTAGSISMDVAISSLINGGSYWPLIASLGIVLIGYGVFKFAGEAGTEAKGTTECAEKTQCRSTTKTASNMGICFSECVGRQQLSKLYGIVVQWPNFASYKGPTDDPFTEGFYNEIINYDEGNSPIRCRSTQFGGKPLTKEERSDYLGEGNMKNPIYLTDKILDYYKSCSGGGLSIPAGYQSPRLFANESCTSSTCTSKKCVGVSDILQFDNSSQVTVDGKTGYSYQYEDELNPGCCPGYLLRTYDGSRKVCVKASDLGK